MTRFIVFLLATSISLHALGMQCDNFMDGFRSSPAPTKSCDAGASELCFKETWHSTNKWPFKMRAEGAQRVVICAHGLADSPYYYKDVSSCMADAGAEVWGIRMAGHDDSTSGANIVNGSWQKWKEQMCCAMKAVRAEGKEPILCGFSTGGVTALVNALSQECGKPAGVMLFSPAIFHNREIIQTLSMTSLSRWLGRMNLPIPHFGARKLACGRYHRMYTSGVDYLNQGMAELYKMEQTLDIPVFSFFSSDDRIIGVEEGIEFLQKKTQSLDLLLMGKKSKDKLKYERRLNHSAIFKTHGCSQKEEVNPQFPVLCQHIREFLKKK